MGCGWYCSWCGATIKAQYIQFYMVQNHVKLNMGCGWHCSWCKIDGGLLLALQLVWHQP